MLFRPAFYLHHLLVPPVLPTCVNMAIIFCFSAQVYFDSYSSVFLFQMKKYPLVIVSNSKQKLYLAASESFQREIWSSCCCCCCPPLPHHHPRHHCCCCCCCSAPLPLLMLSSLSPLWSWFQLRGNRSCERGVTKKGSLSYHWCRSCSWTQSWCRPWGGGWLGMRKGLCSWFCISQPPLKWGIKAKSTN